MSDGHRASADDVRGIADGEVGAVAAMLARAFADDPAFRYIYPDPAALASGGTRLFALMIDSDRQAGRVCVAAGLEAVTCWREPGRSKSGVGEILLHGLPLLNALRGSLGRALKISAAIEAHFPPHPFWYLHIAGCDPAAQGRGLGGAVLRAGLAGVPDDMPAYLETANPTNIGLYERFGFALTGDWRVGTDGPRFWSMLRPPQRRG
jgi:ribosomal protein S18 acetylase RimI-like enzyme